VVSQAAQPQADEAFTPLADSCAVDPQPGGNLYIGLTRRAGEDD
jgi:hypothetical protein